MRHITRPFIVFICNGLLAALLLHPLIANAETHAAGYDYFHFHWNFWWIETALADPELSVFQSNYVLTPINQNLAYHTLAVFWYPVWAVLEPLVGTYIAVTVILWLITTLNGALMVGWLRANRVTWGLALLGGIAFMITPTLRYFYYNTHLNLASWFWLPALLWIWKSTAAQVNRGNYRYAAMLSVGMGLGLWGILLTDSQLPIYAACLLIVYAPYTLFNNQHRLQLIGFGSAALGLGVALSWFIGPLSYLLQWSGSLPATVVDGRPGIPFPDGYLFVLDAWWAWDTPSLGGFGLIAAMIGLGAALMWHGKREKWLWALVMIPPFVLSMGPTLVLGGTEIPLPYRLAFALSDSNLLMPWRFAPVFVIAALTFAGMALHKRAKWWMSVAGILLALVMLRAFWAAPLQPILPSYDFYATIGDEPNADFVVLEVPIGVGTGQIIIGDDGWLEYQLYAIEHRRRVLNGFVARAPLEHFWYVRTDDPLLSWLGGRRDLDELEARRRLEDVVYDWPVGYIVLHQNAIGRERPANQEIIGFLNSQPDLLCPQWIERDAVVWRTISHPQGCEDRTPPVTNASYRVDIGAPNDVFYIQDGWYWAEQLPGIDVRWIGPEPSASVIVDVPPQDYVLHVTAQSYQEPREVTVVVNDVEVGSVIVVPNGLAIYDVDVPADVLGDGNAVVITLTSDAVIDAPGDRSLSIFVESLALEPSE